MDRRSFTQGLSALALVSSASLSSSALQTAAGAAAAPAAADDTRAARQIAHTTINTPLRLGLIGAGSRGQELVRSFLRVPGVRITATADVYPPRFEQLDKVCGYQVARHADYRALLDRKDLDVIVIATPLGLHAEHVLAALKSGRPVYGEKTMAYTIAQAREIVAAVAASKQVFQVGHQYRYSPWIRAALARVQAGEIGDVTHVLAYWNRNNSWRRPVPDPSLERLINWRLYHKWSLGLIAELGSHHMDIANWTMGSYPVAVQASGSICYYRDGRETDDNVQVILSYPGGRRMVFTSMTDNAKQGDQLWLYGTKGSLNLTLQDATFFYEPRKVTAVKEEKGDKKQEPVVTSASYSPANEMPYRGPGKSVEVKDPEDPTTAATRAFVYCVRTGERPIADEHVGLGSALAVVSANEARVAKREVEISAV
ncbi:Gfo/Idh/MocA family protein [Terracidiphilus gabretensis]|uniref:Gfo/Idh/MocA family protein n=1 Tax=Terracidiphilus gabretensis TaxID=1577687 RepID=UPI001E3476C9|nr:Gfo/Idh/MocA family oxidoreductase [Terracidiphilus gabretensis]